MSVPIGFAMPMEQAEAGRDFWTAQNMDAYDVILLLLGECNALNSHIRAAFEAKLDGRRGAVVEGRNAENLLALYSLYAFTDKLIIGSFDLPHGRKLRNLLDRGIATEEELINDVILGAM